MTEKEQAIFLANLGLVTDVILRRFAKWLRPSRAGDHVHFSWDDLRHAGMVGLVDAIRHFDPARGAFSTCANQWIALRIREWLYKAPALFIERRAYKSIKNQEARERALRCAHLDEHIDVAASGEVEEDVRLFAKRKLLRAIYRVPIDAGRSDRQDNLRIGRMIAIHIAGLNGAEIFNPASGSVSLVPEVARAAAELHLNLERARRGFLAFLRRARRFAMEGQR